MMFPLSPDCKNTSFGGMCGCCTLCGRKFEYFNRADGQLILHIVGASENDSKEMKELCKTNGEKFNKKGE